MRRLTKPDGFDLGEIRHRQQVVEAKAYLRRWITDRDLRDVLEGAPGGAREDDGGNCIAG